MILVPRPHLGRSSQSCLLTSVGRRSAHLRAQPTGRRNSGSLLPSSCGIAGPALGFREARRHCSGKLLTVPPNRHAGQTDFYSMHSYTTLTSHTHTDTLSYTPSTLHTHTYILSPTNTSHTHSLSHIFSHAHTLTHRHSLSLSYINILPTTTTHTQYTFTILFHSQTLTCLLLVRSPVIILG